MLMEFEISQGQNWGTEEGNRLKTLLRDLKIILTNRGVS